MNTGQRQLLKVLQFFQDDVKREKWLRETGTTQEELDELKPLYENRYTKTEWYLKQKGLI